MEAQGERITFVDADDNIDLFFLEELKMLLDEICLY